MAVGYTLSTRKVKTPAIAKRTVKYTGLAACFNRAKDFVR